MTDDLRRMYNLTNGYNPAKVCLNCEYDNIPAHLTADKLSLDSKQPNVYVVPFEPKQAPTTRSLMR